jgi:hypothetical protein
MGYNDKGIQFGSRCIVFSEASNDTLAPTVLAENERSCNIGSNCGEAINIAAKTTPNKIKKRNPTSQTGIGFGLTFITYNRKNTERIMPI